MLEEGNAGQVTHVLPAWSDSTARSPALPSCSMCRRARETELGGPNEKSIEFQFPFYFFILGGEIAISDLLDRVFLRDALLPALSLTRCCRRTRLCDASTERLRVACLPP